MPNDTTSKSEYHDVYELNSTAWQPFLEQACLDNDFALKAQHSVDEVDRANAQGRLLHTIDKIGRQVNLLHGYEIRNRHILKIGPQGDFEEQEDMACNQHTGVIMSLMARHGGYDILSDAFRWGTLVQGSNLIETWRDRDGLLQYGRLGYNQFLLDHGLTKTDLSDCGDILTGQWISSDKAKMLVPTAADEIDDINPLTHSSRWPFQGSPAMMNKAGKRLFEQWWHRAPEEVSVVQNRTTGKKMTFEQFKQDALREFGRNDKDFINLLLNAPFLVKFKEIQDKIELKIFVDDELVWDDDNPMKIRDYNYTWVHGCWCPECPRTELKLQSFVRALRDPQVMYNRKVNQAMDIIESQIQGLKIMRSKYLLNPEDAYKSGQGIVLHLSENAPDLLPLKEIFTQEAATEVPASVFNMLEVIERDGSGVGGLNQEILGADDKPDISGVLHAYRTGKALTAQAWMFQDLRASKRDFGRKQVQMVQLNYDQQRIRQILNQDPVPGFYAEDLIKFDCAPTEGLLTDSQQNMYYQELKDLLRSFPEMFAGIITPEMLVKAAPMQFKIRTLQAIQQASQAKQQQQQQQAQIQQVAQQLEVERVKGEILGNRGIAEERRAKAVENQSDAALNRVKTIAEIQDIGQQRILELAQLGLQFEQLSQQNQEVRAKS